jgi:hypothetical protein
VASGIPTPQLLREGGARAFQPAQLARTLLLSRCMLSWDDRAAQGVVAAPPALRMPIPHAVVSGSPPEDHLAPKSQAAGCLSHIERSPRATVSL